MSLFLFSFLVFGLYNINNDLCYLNVYGPVDQINLIIKCVQTKSLLKFEWSRGVAVHSPVLAVV